MKKMFNKNQILWGVVSLMIGCGGSADNSMGLEISSSYPELSSVANLSSSSSSTIIPVSSSDLSSSLLTISSAFSSSSSEPGSALSSALSSSVTLSSSGSLTRSCKRGVAYGHHSIADMNALSPGIDWWYNWYYRPETEVSSVYRDLDIEYVPMRWGAGSAIGVVDAGIPSDSKTLLGFNEPNFGSQANLTATQAAALWPEIEAIADAKGLMLASPATNFCGGDCHDTNPFDYLDDFFAACTDCRVDYIAIHFYVGCDESPGLQNNRAQWLINHIETLKGRFSQPIWLTEFSCSGNPTVADQKAFLEDAVEYLENEPRIMRYAWFAGRADNMTNVDLLGNDGQLTELGQAYVDAPFSQACSY